MFCLSSIPILMRCIKWCWIFHVSNWGERREKKVVGMVYWLLESVDLHCQKTSQLTFEQINSFLSKKQGASIINCKDVGYTFRPDIAWDSTQIRHKLIRNCLNETIAEEASITQFYHRLPVFAWTISKSEVGTLLSDIKICAVECRVL